MNMKIAWFMLIMAEKEVIQNWSNRIFNRIELHSDEVQGIYVE